MFLKKIPILVFLSLLNSSLLLFGGEQIASIQVSNSSETVRVEEPVEVSLLGLGVSRDQWQSGVFEVHDDAIVIPSQVIDTDGDGQLDSILFLSTLKGGETSSIQIIQKHKGQKVPVSAKRTQVDLSVKVKGKWVEGKKVGNIERGNFEYIGGEWADLNTLHVPEEHSDHSNYVRYEGVGIESDLVGYRFYVDWRNGFDIFGKTTQHMILKEVGLDGFESYHHEQDWGMDVLKVGDAVGIGGYGYWDGEKVIRVSDVSSIKVKLLENGHLQSSLKFQYKGWQIGNEKTDLQAVLSMQAGSRMVNVKLTTSTDVKDICAGLVKHEGVELIQGNLDITGEAWSYLATWGKQSLDGKNLGMAILFRKNSLRKITEDEHNHVVVLRSNDRNYNYRFLAAWEGETNGIVSIEAFKAYLEESVTRLTIPSRVRKQTLVGENAKRFPVTSEQALDWSKRMADSQINLLGDHLVNGNFDLDSRRNARWSYTTGLISQAYDDLGIATGDKLYQEQAYKIIDSFIDENGIIADYNMGSYNIDQVNSGKMVLRLYEQTHQAKFKNAADTLREQLKKHPRTSEGGFWHKKRYPYQLWLDGVYMGMPFLAQWEVLFNNAEAIDEAVHEFELVSKYCKDNDTGLYYHAWDEKKTQVWADPETGLSSYFWARGFGWYCMAMVDILDIIPETHASQRESIINILCEVSDALVQHQDSESGCWYQIMNIPERAGNYLESSGSSMFVYALAKALNEGYIEGESYEQAVIKGYEGLIREFVEVDAESNIRFTQTCRVAGLGYGRDGSYRYYMSEPVVTDDPKGVGPFIMAGIEVSKWLSR